jgi:hypothetical protein
MLITVTLEGVLNTLLLTEIELFQLPVTDNDTVTSGNGKSDLHKQNVSVCFFSEQKCKCVASYQSNTGCLKIASTKKYW